MAKKLQHDKLTKKTKKKRPGRHSKKQNKRSSKKVYNGQGRV